MHTKGPWKETAGYIADSTGTRVIAQHFCGSQDTAMMWQNNPADARLIAEAPEMLEEMRLMVRRLDANNLGTVKARAIIARIES